MTLRDALTDAVLATSRWKRRQVGYPELEERRAAWIDAYPQVFVGRSSITVPELNLKLVAYDEWPVTSGELARAYLRRVFDGVPRRPPSPHARGFGWQAPIVCVPVRHRPLAYVDVTSAYWQLLSPFRPDDVVVAGEIIPGTAQWLSADEVETDRRLRHAVVGSIFANHLVFYRYGKLTITPKTNPWSNPTLKVYCMQTLHALCAMLAKAAHLHAWLTDAAIVDATEADEVRRLMATDWVLRSAVKAYGAGAVVTATTYCVGEKMSMDLVNGTTDLSRAEPRAFSNLKRVPAKRLLEVRRGVAA